MIKVAITGNIAAGKSELEKQLQNLGYLVFDTDKIAHDCLINNKARVINTFGPEILSNGEISREKLGNIVFNDKEKLQKLNNIIHPEVIKEINTLFEQYKNENYLFVSIPLLFEAKMENMFDRIIFVYADDAIRLERLMKRNNLNKTDALKRINSQRSQTDKMAKSDYIIKNNGSLEDLKLQINKFF